MKLHIPIMSSEVEVAYFKNWNEYTAKERSAIKLEATSRGVSEIYIMTERNALYEIEYAKDLALCEIKLAKAELEALI